MGGFWFGKPTILLLVSPFLVHRSTAFAPRQIRPSTQKTRSELSYDRSAQDDFDQKMIIDVMYHSPTAATAVKEKSDNGLRNFHPTGLNPRQEEELESILDDALFRISFLMESGAFGREEAPAAVRDMFHTCVDAVEIGNSTIPGAGRGLFATRDIPKGTIVAFYPFHAIGCKFESGSCFSMQIAPSQEDMIDAQNTEYALFSFLERPLLGVDLQARYPNEPRSFVDMNPASDLHPGWYCGLINDAAIIRHLNGDLDYYRVSRGPKRNVEIVPFGPVAPFQVAVTTRDVSKGEEFFVSYGYNYWSYKLRSKDDDEQETKGAHRSRSESLVWKELQAQEDAAVLEMLEIIRDLERKYSQAMEDVAQIFDGLAELPIPEAVNLPHSLKDMSSATIESLHLASNAVQEIDLREGTRRSRLRKVLSRMSSMLARRFRLRQGNSRLLS